MSCITILFTNIKMGRAPIMMDFIEREMQATYFAWALMMPKDEFMEVINKNTDSKNNVRIDEHFRVSGSVVVNYGHMLGLFQ